MYTFSAMLAMSMGERLTDSATMLIKGMLMVFAVLAILMFILLGMRGFFTKGEPKPAEAKKAPEAPKSKPTAAPAPVAPRTDDAAIVAAITAAIAMTLAEEQAVSGNPLTVPATGTNGFRVVSFRRVYGRTPWNA